jgi:alpha-L-arabinofuranosidase
VNSGEKTAAAPLAITGFVPEKSLAHVLTLEGPLNALNTANTPESIKPVISEWTHGLENGETKITFPAHSFTVVRF